MTIAKREIINAQTLGGNVSESFDRFISQVLHQDRKLSRNALHFFFSLAYYISMRKVLVLFFFSIIFLIIAPRVYATQYQSEATATIPVGNPPATSGTGASKGHPATSTICPKTSDRALQLIRDRYLFDFANNSVFSPKNFGDPICDYTLNGLAAVIDAQDHKHFHCWYDVIVKNESAYDPNIEQLYDPYDPAHAWGNFQMGRGKNDGPHDHFDHGDVDWQTQVVNAVGYNAKLGNSFAYWSTRRFGRTICVP